MNQTKVIPDSESLPEEELIIDVVLVPDGDGAAESVQGPSDLDVVLDGDRQPPEVWDDGSELEEFLAEDGNRRRWIPRALAAAGGLAVLATALVVTVGQSSEAAERVAVLPETIEPSLRGSSQYPAPAQPVLQPDPSPVEEIEPSTTRRRRALRSHTGSISKEDLRKQVLELMGVDGEAAPAVQERPAPRVIPAKNTNTPMFLASRIYRRNKRTLLACDRLAQRRGESLGNSRALFRIKLDAQGGKSVKVAGKGVEDRRLACYRVMATRWRLPRTRDGYRTEFQHIH